MLLVGIRLFNGDKVLSEVEIKAKNDVKDELYKQYNWFHSLFLSAIQRSSNEFFSDLFDFHLISVSKNINILFQGDDYFVTKIRIGKDYDAFLRCSESAVKIILDEVLGQNKKFKIANITELEAKIISSFNDYLYENISQFLKPVPQIPKGTQSKAQKRKNFDAVHLTLFIKSKKSDSGAKIIISLPQVLLAPALINVKDSKFDESAFKSSKIDVKISIGTTKFSLKELKNLEKEDIVIFENSNIHSMTLIYKNYKKQFKINPNPGLITSIDNDNGGINMEEQSLSQDLWDNIQVEMGAEFEKVKITLGELKNIEKGLVLDLSSVYENKISLKVEDKTIAKGELVIINDRYGVRIDEVFASEKDEKTEQIQQASPEVIEGATEEPAEATAENSDEEFDYSDFELDDQDI